MSTQPTSGLSRVRSRLNLEYPMSLGTFEKYEEAQKLVDTLSDREFPVQNCLIVGTDLKQLERITGRLTWGRVLLGGALSGVWLGLFVGLIFALFAAQGGVVPIVLSTVLFGALFGIAWAAAGYALTGGQRDFSSVSLIVPSKYEVLVEHKFAQQARDILGTSGLGGATGYVPASGTGGATGGYASDAPSGGQQPPPANQI